MRCNGPLGTVSGVSGKVASAPEPSDPPTLRTFSPEPSAKPYLNLMTKGKAVLMRIVKLAALGFLALGIPSRAAYSTTQFKTGIAAQASMRDNEDYKTGVGLNGFVQSEHAMGMGAGGLGLRANFDNYQAEGGTGADDIQEGGVALTAMGGPNMARFQPRLGGHIGYAREEGGNFLDLGPDVMASLLFTPHVGLNALITPTWFMNGDRTDYLGTKVGVGVTWNVPGA